MTITEIPVAVSRTGMPRVELGVLQRLKGVQALGTQNRLESCGCRYRRYNISGIRLNIRGPSSVIHQIIY